MLYRHERRPGYGENNPFGEESQLARGSETSDGRDRSAPAPLAPLPLEAIDLAGAAPPETRRSPSRTRLIFVVATTTEHTLAAVSKRDRVDWIEAIDTARQVGFRTTKGGCWLIWYHEWSRLIISFARCV